MPLVSQFLNINQTWQRCVAFASASTLARDSQQWRHQQQIGAVQLPARAWCRGVFIVPGTARHPRMRMLMMMLCTVVMMAVALATDTELPRRRCRYRRRTPRWRRAAALMRRAKDDLQQNEPRYHHLRQAGQYLRLRHRCTKAVTGQQHRCTTAAVA